MIVLRTDNPQELLQAIYDAIAKKGNYGHVLTWNQDNEGYLHHNPDTSNNWAAQARFKPIVRSDKRVLAFFIKSPQGTNDSIPQAVYGVYHGRFLSMMLSHFPDLFTVHDITTRAFTSSWEAYCAAL